MKVKGHLFRSERYCTRCKKMVPWYHFPRPINKSFCAYCYTEGIRVPTLEVEEEPEEEKRWTATKSERYQISMRDLQEKFW
jgi:NAD-dependent SIR2 family protein deacetylase